MEVCLSAMQVFLLRWVSQLSAGGFSFLLTHSTALMADSLHGVMVVPACQSAQRGDDNINLHLSPR